MYINHTFHNHHSENLKLCGKPTLDGSFGHTGHCPFLFLGQTVKGNAPHAMHIVGEVKAHQWMQTLSHHFYLKRSNWQSFAGINAAFTLLITRLLGGIVRLYCSVQHLC
jgi:hypothetical protein